MSNIINPNNRLLQDLGIQNYMDMNLEPEYPIHHSYYPGGQGIIDDMFFPEMPKGNLDLKDVYEVSSIPESPDTPLDSVEKLQEKRVMPKEK